MPRQTKKAAMTDFLLKTLDNGLLTLTLNRPERRNALHPDMIKALLGAVQDAAVDPDVRAVILTGAGGHFCVGGDVKTMADGSRAPQTLQGRALTLRAGMEISRLLHTMAKPTIAVVSGNAAGAGFSLAMACDFRIVGTSAKLTTAFAKVGLSGDYGGTYFLTQALGSIKARELYLLSPLLSAADALALGIANRVVPDAELESTGREFASKLAQGPTLTYGFIKNNINNAEHMSIEDCFNGEAFNLAMSAHSEDHKEAAKAFVEKRQPAFRAR
jgi:2-(1,2-epoxy-1,2-dihydrophenyl)acetyl-CoA isomerase